MVNLFLGFLFDSLFQVMYSLAMNIFKRNKPVVKVAVAPEETIINVPVEAMNEKFGREAGRWCDHCKQNGSHHTDRHNDFASAVLQNA